MSSSGLIYAGIVGAWAVYLVPVWLRREEQLNEARQKARYAAAIRTLGRTEQFEKRWLAEEALAATGTDGAARPPAQAPASTNTPPAKKAGPPSARRPQPAGSKGAASGHGSGNASNSSSPTADRRAQPAGRKPVPVPALEQQRRKSVTARLPQHVHGEPRTAPPTQKRQQAKVVRHRGVLLMRRRRVVAFLFTLATTGAVVSATLGVSYIWAMLAPAALFSVYIINILRDERLRAEERYRRRQAVLAAERRRERQRAAESVAPPAPVVRSRPEDFRRAASG